MSGDHPDYTQGRRGRERTVSVVVPCYNKGPYLRETLDSALGQTVPPAEVIVVDDGSTDDSAAIAEAYGPPVTVLRQENRGESAARNRGIRRARSAWIALLDADDVWTPPKLERQLACIDASEDESLVCVYTDVYLFRNGERIGEHRKPEYHAMRDFRVRMLCDWSVNTSSVLLRAEAVEEVQFPENIRDSEDMIFFLELRERGSFLRIPECLVGYRRNEENQTHSPWHHLHSVEARYRWFLRNRRRYTAEERDEIRRELARQLLYPHDIALGTLRDVSLVRACRSLHEEIHPEPSAAPETLRRRLYPGWMYRIRDRVGALLQAVR